MISNLVPTTKITEQKFGDAKGVFRSRNSKTARKYNDQQKRDKNAYNGQ